jgi:hypothetical protein
MKYVRGAVLGLFAGAICGAVTGSVILGTSHWIKGPSWESPLTSANDGISFGGFCGAIIGLISGLTVGLVKHLAVRKQAQ